MDIEHSMHKQIYKRELDTKSTMNTGHPHQIIAGSRFSEYCMPGIYDIGSFRDLDQTDQIGISKYHVDCPLVCILGGNGFLSGFHLPADDQGINTQIVDELTTQIRTRVNKLQDAKVLVFTNDSFSNPELTSDESQNSSRKYTLTMIQNRLEGIGHQLIHIPVRLPFPGQYLHEQRLDYIIGNGIVSAWQNLSFEESVLIGTIDLNNL